MQVKLWIIAAAAGLLVAGCAPPAATGDVAVSPTEYGDDDNGGY